MPSTRLASPFTFTTTAADVVAGLDLHGRRALVTGGSGGIGLETARALASAGAAVSLTGRQQSGAERAAADIADSTGNPQVDGRVLDLADPASVEALADSVEEPVDILVLNAGVMGIPERTLGVDGHELHLGTNHVGHFRLATRLLPRVRAAGGARVVVLSSRAHLDAAFDFDDPDFAQRPYDPAIAYAQSKTANALFAVAAARLWRDDGVVVNAAHPGAVIESGLTRRASREDVQAAIDSGLWTFKTPQQAAATSVFLACSPLAETVSGGYFENCQQADPDDPTLAGLDAAGVAPHALELATADRLWDLSRAWTS